MPNTSNEQIPTQLKKRCEDDIKELWPDSCSSLAGDIQLTPAKLKSATYCSKCHMCVYLPDEHGFFHVHYVHDLRQIFQACSVGHEANTGCYQKFWKCPVFGEGFKI